MGKYEIVENLLQNTINDIKSGKEQWVRFLHTASKMYKYSFKEQVLIHVQRPDATACASMNVWNKAMNCYINKGAKGIALIDDLTEHRLKYVFDVSNVTAAKRIGKYPKLWVMRDEYKGAVLEHLESIYGKTNSEESFIDRIVELSVTVAENYSRDMVSDFENFFLEYSLSDYSSGDLYWILCNTLAETIAYTTLLRCGISDNEIYHLFHFSYLSSIDNTEIMSYIGDSCAKLTQPILSEIGKTVFKCEEKLEKDLNKDYNALKRESVTGRIGVKEENIDGGIRIRKGGGLLFSEVSETGTARGTIDEVRITEEDISEGKQIPQIRDNDNYGETETTSAGNSASSRRENGSISEADGGGRERERGVENEGPDAVGTEDEQHHTRSGGNRAEGDRLQLEENNDGRKAGNDELSAFFMPESRDDFGTKEISTYKAENYKIRNQELGFGTPKEKYCWNIEAIKTLYRIEEENRDATPEEQEVLSKYVGWGGLSDVFDNLKSSWSAEYNELKDLLSKEEYESARASTLNAHYTSPVIIDSIYSALDKFGFSKGNIIEPAMAVGNFFGRLPESMKNSRLYGVELDDISGRIAKKLYPNANISICGFEESKFDNSFFDVAIGNVPFGQYSVSDKKYDKHNFLIHDYFFAKSLDLVREGGVVAFVTSKGTLDKQNPMVRKYLSQRAELIGAIRLPNTAFKGNAGTEVTSDIIFLKKRDRVIDIEADWIYLGKNKDNISMNQYFVEHPEMVLGKMEMVSGHYGMESTCIPDNSSSLEEQLQRAIGNLSAEIKYNDEFDMAVEEEESEKVIPASADVKNFSYTEHNGKIYYRENSKMQQVELSEKDSSRVKGLIALRDHTYELINMQLEEYSEKDITVKRYELNTLYDSFIKSYGNLNSRTNRRVFSSDSSYNLLCSLEKTNDNGEVIGKADMFYKRTIKKREVATSVDTSSEALAISLGEKAKVDLTYMSTLCNKDIDTITSELVGVIFLNPVSEKWETADEYLSGNVREKLKIASNYAENDHRYENNVIFLKKVQPKDLDASEIDIRLGATWVDTEYIEEFMQYLFETPKYMLNGKYMGVNYSYITSEWNIKGKNMDNRNTLVTMTYGTKRANGYRILEDTLNLRDVRIYDIVEEDGKENRVLNRKETMLACQKQDMIKEKFKEWVYADPVRRQALVEKYNNLFNSHRPREFDGSHLTFEGMSPDITLKPHQLNAVARQLYGGNTLLAHCVGAGKTFEICAAAMEKKRLGLCQKNLIVVPNHLTEQWASEFLSLYPGANILAATKKDFEPANRKKFCSRIATGDYDAVIIGHSQFEKIPLSTERQKAAIQKQIYEITDSINDLTSNHGERYSIKQLEKTRKSLEKRLKTLNDAEKKDDVVTFEQLGIDSLFVDESHSYKNLFLYTKMRNVSGIAQTEAKKSSDMYAKCQYIDGITGGKGITFATGTPISNSMTELYTNMRYLQSNTLKKLNLSNFDSWAATFGETQTAIELAPEGTGFRTKTRFAKFYNLPELISLFKEAADIQTADMLNLPVPEAEYQNVVLKPSGYQKDTVANLGERAELIRAGAVPSHIDNMLKVTNDGRKLALDQRLIDAEYPDYENSKANACVERAYAIWEETKEQKSAQLIFCDLSTPKADGFFNVYSDLKEKLIAKGVPEKEIAFIHDANTDTKKSELFAKVRSGQIRFLIGSTSKMGAGTNVQDRLIALHHLDVPWRPSDIEQQEGRILRQGNQNEKVKIFRYVTENTFDSYSWQLIENKQRFIGQIMTSKSPVRSCDDVDATALSYAEVKTLSTGDPYIKEKMELDMDVSKLRLLKANHNSQKYRHQDNITQHYPRQIALLKEKIEGYKHDVALYNANKNNPDNFVMTIQGVTYTERKEAGAKIIECAMAESKSSSIFTKLGTYQGLELSCGYDKESFRYVMRIKGSLTHDIEMGHDESGNIVRLNNAYESLQKKQDEFIQNLEYTERQMEIAIEEVDKPFPQEKELAEKLERLSQINALLNMDEKESVVIDDVEEIEQEEVALISAKPSVSIPGVKENIRFKI